MSDQEIEGKSCPFHQEPCQGNCQLLIDSDESMIRKCALAVIAQQLDILAKEDKKGF